MPIVDLDLIRKIEAVALDERGDARIREIAIGKLEAYQTSHPHLFAELTKEHLATSYRAEKDEAPWSDVTDVGPKPPTKGKARFMDIRSWRETTNGNPTITLMMNGVELRIVLFKYKKAPDFGWLRIDTLTDKTTFCQACYATEAEAHQAAWDAVCAI